MELDRNAIKQQIDDLQHVLDLDDKINNLKKVQSMAAYAKECDEESKAFHLPTVMDIEVRDPDHDGPVIAIVGEHPMENASMETIISLVNKLMAGERVSELIHADVECADDCNGDSGDIKYPGSDPRDLELFEQTDFAVNDCFFGEDNFICTHPGRGFEAEWELLEMPSHSDTVDAATYAFSAASNTQTGEKTPETGTSGTEGSIDSVCVDDYPIANLDIKPIGFCLVSDSNKPQMPIYDTQEALVNDLPAALIEGDLVRIGHLFMDTQISGLLVGCEQNLQSAEACRSIAEQVLAQYKTQEHDILLATAAHLDDFHEASMTRVADYLRTSAADIK